MNLQPLFTTTRVVVAVYRTVSTTVLLYYLMRRMGNGKPSRDHHHGRFSNRGRDNDLD
jgi:hypothetical protein